MDKHELIKLTLDQLMEHFKLSPESFQYQDSLTNPSKSSFPTIIWQPKVQMGDSVVADPNNNHTVVLTFNEHLEEFKCFIYLKTPINLETTPADSVIVSRRSFEKWRRNYKRFIKLKKLILARDTHIENMGFLSKLSSVFPHTMDCYLFKD